MYWFFATTQDGAALARRDCHGYARSEDILRSGARPSDQRAVRDDETRQDRGLVYAKYSNWQDWRGAVDHGSRLNVNRDAQKLARIAATRIAQRVALTICLKRKRPGRVARLFQQFLHQRRTFVVQSMLLSITSCGSVPWLNFMSTASGRAPNGRGDLLRDGLGEPTQIRAVGTGPWSNRARAIGGQPRSAPMRSSRLLVVRPERPRAPFVGLRHVPGRVRPDRQPVVHRSAPARGDTDRRTARTAPDSRR